MDAGKTAGAEPLGQFFGAGLGGQFDRKGQDQARVALGGGQAGEFGVNRLGRVVLHWQRGVLVKQAACAGKQELEVVVELGHGAHGGAGAADRVGLVNGNGRGHAFDLVYGGLVHAVQKLARVG